MNNCDFPSVRQLLDLGAEKYGESVFLKFVKNGEIVEKSFVDVRNDSLTFCRMIRNMSKEKQHIAIVGETSYEYIIALTGILISGCVAVPFSPELSCEEAKNLFAQADIDALFYDNNFNIQAEQLKDSCTNIKSFFNIGNEETFEEICSKFSAESEYSALSDYAVDKDQCAAIIFTSGTTGNRKGAMLSTNSLVGNIMYKDFCSDVFRENDVLLSVLPMYHIYCFSGDFIKNLKDGVQVCINGSVKNLLSNLQLFEPRVMRIVPLMAETLLRRIKMFSNRNPQFTPNEAAKKILGKNIKHLISGGAYLNPDLVEEYAKYGIYLRQGYGMTEAGCRISVPDENISPSSVGRVLDICDVRIQNGEIQVKTPTVMLGYYNQPEETQKMFTPDGWLKTGDIGYVTESRELFITGRVKNLIILSNGENVSPEAIEKKFSSYPLVEEVMVYAENNRIVAEIYPNLTYAESSDIEDISLELNKITDLLNENAKQSHYVSGVIVRNEPFEKTGSGKIIRKENTVI